MKSLVKRAQRGDDQAFVELIEENKQAMYKVAVGILKNDFDAADAIQQSILTCYEKLKELKNILLTTPYQNLNKGISMMQNKIVSEKTRFFFFNIQLIPITDFLILLFFRQILEEVQNQIPYIHPF